MKSISSFILFSVGILTIASFNARYSLAFLQNSQHNHRSFQISQPYEPRCKNNNPSPTKLYMALDLVTYLRTEWVAAALCTNQIPRSSKSVLQLGTEDGRVVNFVPRTVEELFTSSLEKDGVLSLSANRALKQQRERRGSGITIRYVDQPADNLKEMKDGSVDVVVSLLAADKMRENGFDWKKSIKEAARVLKPGGRFLFVEKTEIEGVDYLEYMMDLSSYSDEEDKSNSKTEDIEEDVKRTIFELIGYDDVDLVLVPHIAGVVTKSINAGLTKAEIEQKKALDEKARLADLSISAFERGLKKRKKKKQVEKADDTTTTKSPGMKK